MSMLSAPYVIFRYVPRMIFFNTPWKKNTKHLYDLECIGNKNPMN